MTASQIRPTGTAEPARVIDVPIARDSAATDKLTTTSSVVGIRPSAADRAPGTAAAPSRIDRESGWDRYGSATLAGLCWLFLVAAVVADRLVEAPSSVVIGGFVLAYLAGGALPAVAALRELIVDRHVNVDLLMVTAAIGAATVDAWAEGAVLLGLFSASGALEHHALGRTRRAVRALMALSPPVATVIRAEGEAVVPVEALAVGDEVLIRPGERVAVDGAVIAGETTVDQAAITGESIPVGKATGDSVFAGTINGYGAIRVRVGKLHQESTLARIVAIVEEAQAQKSRTQRFTDRFEGSYAIGVIVASALLALLPPLVFGRDFGDAFYRAMTLLVVASPCALVISTPASTLSALANAARNGILFKGSNHLENAGALDIVAFDKTGTLTTGRPALTDVLALDPADRSARWDEATLLRFAAAAERLSEHPLAQAIVTGAMARGSTLPAASGFRALPGRGIVATVDGVQIAVGNEALVAELGLVVPPATAAAVDRLRAAGKTTMLVGDDRGVRGIVAVADTPRPIAAAAVAELKRLGIARTVMLTGDDERVGRAIAGRVGIGEVHADLLPEAKLAVIRRLQRDGAVAMVGDGVNDAPALATATIGVAMGAAGSDVALETADVVLMSDDLAKFPYAIALSRRTRRTIRQNLTFSLAVIAILIVLTLTVGIPLPLGVVGHEGSTVIVVLNGLRLLRSPRDA
jgi:Cd2+/Zn2+-exporting ATPase